MPLGGGALDLTTKGFFGGPTWVPTEAQVITQPELLHIYGSCRSCSLGDVRFTASSEGGMPGPNEENGVAFAGHLEGADLRGARLLGPFRRWDLDGADLSGANLSGTVLVGSTLDAATVSGTNFDGAILNGTRMTALRAQAPPSFAGIEVGDFDHACTVFRDSDLVDAKLTIAGKRRMRGRPAAAPQPSIARRDRRRSRPEPVRRAFRRDGRGSARTGWKGPDRHRSLRGELRRFPGRLDEDEVRSSLVGGDELRTGRPRGRELS